MATTASQTCAAVTTPEVRSAAVPLLPLDPLTLPLTGVQLIEASAGTGKTWTLAALVVRLVLGHRPGCGVPGPGLMPPQILVMTFTEAATAELRERIRQRLTQAAGYFQQRAGHLGDPFLLALGEQIKRDHWPVCAQRLDLAAQWMDEAAIFTIHGWSSRMLKTHAFDSASLFTQTRVEDAQRLQLQATQDYWRQWFYALDRETLGALENIGDTPLALLDKLKARWKILERAPQPPGDAPTPPDVWLLRWSSWQRQRVVLEAQARAGWSAPLQQTLSDAAAARAFKGVSLNNFALWMAQMAQWSLGADIKLATLARFGSAALRAKGWAEAARWPALADLEALHAHLADPPPVLEGLLTHAAQAVHAAYQRAKAQAAQFDFADLLQKLYHAVHVPTSPLAAAIAAQYPVALVDEFQDTDPWQYGTLSKIYSCHRSENEGLSAILLENAAVDWARFPADKLPSPPPSPRGRGSEGMPGLTGSVDGGDGWLPLPSREGRGERSVPAASSPLLPLSPGDGRDQGLVPAASPPLLPLPPGEDWGEGEAAVAPTGLIMIGDPKQAIYSFRGADLATYLRARGEAQGIYTLTGNHRATAAMVAAVNQVFGQAYDPFGGVPFVGVRACNAQVSPLIVNGQPQTALTVWHLDGDVPARRALLMENLAAVFASQMVALLQSGAAQPGDMAVLVRDRFEAAAMRQALALRGVRSVYLSESNSVYASPQALDLWRLLRAVASPTSNRLVRAALATPSWCLDASQLEALFADEAAWDAQLEQFMQWQRVWRTQGFLPMLYRLLHDPGLARRLMLEPTQGERALTNLLHLGELLQAMSLELQGEGALIRYLEAQLRHPQASGEVAQLRLESDAHLVQVITLHKSKGLEYPLVFLPFAALFRAEGKGSTRDDDERLAEDVRLLYVALTRARQALWMGVAAVKGDVDDKTGAPRSALAQLLGRTTAEDLSARLQHWASDDISVLRAPAPSAQRWQPVLQAREARGACVAQRRLTRDWWSASFSALTRALNPRSDGLLPSESDEKMADAQLDQPDLADLSDQPDQPDQPDPPELALGLPAWLVDASPPASVAPDLFAPQPFALDQADAVLGFNVFAAGARYGTLLHDLLEWQAEHAWPAGDSPELAAMAAPWQTLLVRQVQRLGLPNDQAAMLHPWMHQICMTNLPLAIEGNAQGAIVLKALRRTDFWPEMGFALPVRRLPSQAIDVLIARAVWPGQARPSLPDQWLQGMVTGFIDLVLVHQGRYYVLDYKSNRLADYSPGSMQRAMLVHRYDVQAALYLLALHRLLKHRLPDYDYQRHVGGALYLFVRGIDQPGAGLTHLAPPRTLIESLDQAFCAATPAEVSA